MLPLHLQMSVIVVTLRHSDCYVMNNLFVIFCLEFLIYEVIVLKCQTLIHGATTRPQNCVTKLAGQPVPEVTPLWQRCQHIDDILIFIGYSNEYVDRTASATELCVWPRNASIYRPFYINCNQMYYPTITLKQNSQNFSVLKLGQAKHSSHMQV